MVSTRGSRSQIDLRLQNALEPVRMVAEEVIQKGLIVWIAKLSKVIRRNLDRVHP